MCILPTQLRQFNDITTFREAAFFLHKIALYFLLFLTKTNNTRAEQKYRKLHTICVYSSRMNTGCMRWIIKPEKEQKDKERVCLFMGMCTMQWQFTLAFTSQLSRHLLTCWTLSVAAISSESPFLFSPPDLVHVHHHRFSQGHRATNKSNKRMKIVRKQLSHESWVWHDAWLSC